MYSSKPNSFSAAVTCSQAIVFFDSFSEISLASDATRVMNSTQQSTRTSRKSFDVVTPEPAGRISVRIFWTVAEPN